MPREILHVLVGPIQAVKRSNGSIAGYILHVIQGSKKLTLNYPKRKEALSARATLISLPNAHRITSPHAVEAIEHLITDAYERGKNSVQVDDLET